MIQYLGLKATLLKSMIDKTKCVLVQQVDIVNGKPKRTHHWKRVEDVEHHGKTILGHEHLPDDHPHKKTAPKIKKTPPPNKPLSTKYHQEVKDVTEEYFDSFYHPPKKNMTKSEKAEYEKERRADFYRAMRGLGLDWEPCPPGPKSEGIELMRAKARLNAAVSQGFDPFDPYKDTPSATSPDTADTPFDTKTESQKTTTKKPAEKKVIKPSEPMPLVSLTNTRLKVRQEYKDLAQKFLTENCDGDKTKFMEKMEEFGFEWSKNDAFHISYMNANMTLCIAMEYYGFNPFDPSKRLETKPTYYDELAQAKLSEDLAQNDREKRWIRYINKITSVETLQGCAKLGVIPQNNRAASFITKKWLPEFALAMLNPDNSDWFKSVTSKGRKNIPEELRDYVMKTWGMDELKRLADQVPNRKSYAKEYESTPTGFGKAMSNQLELLGCKKNCLVEGFSRMSHFSMEYLVSPREALTNYKVMEAIPHHTIYQSLNEGFSQYTTDKYGDKYLSNVGYTGYDAQEYTDRYNLENEGVVQYLNKIAQNTPDLKDKCDEMKQTYDEMMKLCKCNPYIMNLVLSTPVWSTSPAQRISVSRFGRERLKTLPEMHRAIILADNLSDTVIKTLTERGYSQQNILSALQNVELNDALDRFEIQNDNGGRDVIDFTTLTNDKGKPLVNPKKGEHLWGAGMLYFTQAKYLTQNNIDLTSSPDYAQMKNSLDYYSELKATTSITAEDYKQLHKLSNKFLGLTYAEKKGNIDWDNVKVSKDWQNDYYIKVADDDTNHDVILANLLMAKTHHDVHSGIASLVTNNAASAYNKNGADYSGNFAYYSGSVMKDVDATVRLSQKGNTGDSAATLTTSELSDKIKKQMDRVKLITPEYVAQLSSYYKSIGSKAERDSVNKRLGYTPEAFMDSPIKDIIYDMSQSIAENIEECANKPFFGKMVSKRLDYVPFDFNAKQQAKFSKPKAEEVDPTALKEARLQLFKAAHASVRAMDKEDSIAYWKEMMEKNFDYVKGEKTLDGEEMQPIHSVVDKNGRRITTVSVDSHKVPNRIALLNSPVMVIEDSIMEDNFRQRVADIKKQYPNKPKRSTVVSVFSAGSSWSAAEAIGIKGQLRTGTGAINPKLALDPGIHVSDKIGAVSAFAVNQLGAARQQDVSNNRAEGIVMMMSAVRGETPSVNSIKRGGYTEALNAKYTSISYDAQFPQNSPPKGFELILKDSALAYVHHMADVSSRTIGVNTYLDADGYKDANGVLTHDVNGISVNMDWGDD